jgi:HipA-like protein
MPVQVTSHPHQAIRPWLWVLLSDNESMLRRWAREFHDGLIGAIANGQ